MQLPKKITPDSIIDAVVEVKYLSNTPFEVLIGLFFKAFDESYVYTTRPLKNHSPGLQVNLMPGLVINMGGQSLLYNERISIKLLPNAFVFSCLDKYIGWKFYKPEIDKALKIIGNTNQVVKWNRVGLRYITEYLKTDLKSCTKFSFSFGFPDVQSISSAFRTEFEYKNAKVILNLNNKIPIVRQQATNREPEVIPTSIIDVDVIREPLEIEKIDDLAGIIDQVHEIEKEVFFSLLTDDFLKTLNPEY
jgi:uncharacterized protein (TIGR04255 family)